ncbi:Alpha/Beta hydrolase protein [Leptodontidium sp. 2 PMI_412]|nr:Alpha/Beta hydrolase protein [Leptodontidium sp. 2 PMI_412]
MPSIVLIILYICLHLAQAVPTGLEQRDVSPDILSRFQLMEQYAAAAYCVENSNSPGAQLSCHVDNCPRVDAADTNTSLEFENSSRTDATGFVAIDYTNQLIVVAFRGTASLLGWILNFNFNRVPTTICNGCGVHEGFWTAWLGVRDAISDAVRDAVAAKPVFNVVCTGHGQGGAIASLAAADLRNAGYNAALFSVIHIRPEYYIRTPNFVPISPADIKVCPGSLDRDCNAGAFWFDVISHGWYFDNIWLCFPIVDPSIL